jgi:hypothetical protein
MLRKDFLLPHQGRYIPPDIGTVIILSKDSLPPPPGTGNFPPGIGKIIMLRKNSLSPYPSIQGTFLLT